MSDNSGFRVVTVKSPSELYAEGVQRVLRGIGDAILYGSIADIRRLNRDYLTLQLFKPAEDTMPKRQLEFLEACEARVEDALNSYLY